MTIVEINNQLVEKAQNSIKNSLSRVAKKLFKGDGEQQNKFIAHVVKRLNGSSDLNGVVKETDLVIEAVVENIKIKHGIFETIDKVCSAVIFVCPFLSLNGFYLKQKSSLSNHRLHRIIRFSHRILHRY